MNINECKQQGFIRHAQPNTHKAKSLMEISDIKEKTIHSAEFNDENVNAYLPLAYDSLREMLEALCLIFGYNVTNHICLGELVKDLIKNFDYLSFDRFRYVRNGINYYGKKIGFEDGKEIIRKIFEMRKVIKKEVNARIMHK